jgi:hypothetical protein
MFQRIEVIMGLVDSNRTSYGKVGYNSIPIGGKSGRSWGIWVRLVWSGWGALDWASGPIWTGLGLVCLCGWAGLS